jgi:hypothetical protein
MSLLTDLPGALYDLLNAVNNENPALLFFIYAALLLWLMLTLPRP